MPANDQRVIRIILEEMGEVEERCEGYREALIDAVADVISAVRQNRIRAGNVQKNVSHKCNSVAQLLSASRRRPTG